MKLAVLSHKYCWHSDTEKGAVLTDGGFAAQVRALSELFDETLLVVPIGSPPHAKAGQSIRGHNIRFDPLTPRLQRSAWVRRLLFPLWLLQNRRAVLNAIRNADVVHTPVPSIVGTTAMVIAAITGKRLFVRHCGDWSDASTAFRRFNRWFMRRFSRSPQALMLATGGARSSSVLDAEIKWIFSTSLTQKDIAALAAERRMPQLSAPRIITVARQDSGKGTDLLIRSVPALVERFPGIELHIVGSGPQLADNVELASALGLADRVVFHGSIRNKEVLALLRQADLFCLPTRSEGFPKAVVEAMASGLPVVATDVSVLPDLIGESRGRIMESRTADCLVDAISWCLSDAHRYVMMSEEAMRAAEKYTLEAWKSLIGEYMRSRWGRPEPAHSDTEPATLE